jgi:hypothetical protein
MSKRMLALKYIRYPIELPMRYESSGRRGSIAGQGNTLNINTGGVRFAADQDLPPGLNIQLVISWPVRLPDGVALSLSMFGMVQNSELHEVEVSVSRYEFRTRGGGNLESMETADLPTAVAK